MLDIGFTGTSSGMANMQLMKVHQLLGEFKEKGAAVAHHGCCEGADDQFNFMADAMSYHVIGHPGVTKTGNVWKRGGGQCDEYRDPKFFLDRNKDIVVESDIMIATPKEVDEQMRSGTWATIRYARKDEKPLFIVFPDGRIQIERAEKVFDQEYVVYLGGVGCKKTLQSIARRMI